MAEFTHKTAMTDSTYIATIEEYDFYSHYIADLIGEDLSHFWSTSGKSRLTGISTQTIWGMQWMHWITSIYWRRICSNGILKFAELPQQKYILFFSCTENYTNLCVLQLIMASKNPHSIAYMFHDYTHRIHSKAIPSDPNFICITVTCGKIEEWCKCHYPSFIP